MKKWLVLAACALAVLLSWKDERAAARAIAKKESRTVLFHAHRDVRTDEELAARAEASSLAEAPSLAGTEVDGAIPIDDRGHFVASEEVLRLFDYFLSTQGERDDASIRARVAAEARARAGAEADGVVALLDRYRSYREDLARRMDHVTPGDMRAAVVAMHGAQRAMFGADASRLFASENAETERVVGEAAIRNDATLDEATREARLAALDEALPPDLRALRAERARVMNEVQRLVSGAAR